MAEFRIDQATPGVGTPGESRHDLVVGEAITLTATSPAGATFSWELIDVMGSLEGLTVTGADQAVININDIGITGPCAFLVRLTAVLDGETTTTTRIASIRTEAGLRYPLFSETSPSNQTLSTNDADLSTDNAQYTDLAGRGAGQNWRGWAQWGYELTKLLDETVAAGPARLPAAPYITDRAVQGSDGEVVLGGVVLTAGDYSSVGLGLRLMGRLTSGATDDAVFRVYDMGTRGSPGPGTLVASVAVADTTAPDITFSDLELTIAASSGTDQLASATRMYEFRLEVLGGDAEIFTLLFGGFILGDEVE